MNKFTTFKVILVLFSFFLPAFVYGLNQGDGQNDDDFFCQPVQRFGIKTGLKFSPKISSLCLFFILHLHLVSCFIF